MKRSEPEPETCAQIWGDKPLGNSARYVLAVINSCKPTCSTFVSGTFGIPLAGDVSVA